MTLKKLLITFLYGFFMLPQIVKSQSIEDQYLIIGTYTRNNIERKNSEGIYIYKFNSNTGRFKQMSVTKDIKDPSYLVFSPNGKFVYSVNETDTGSVTAFSFEKKSGILTKINTRPSGGAHPCHINIDKTGKWVIVGNYTGGNLSVFPTNSDGSLGTAIETINHEGSGPNKNRQEKPHVHSVNLSPDNQELFVADLGIDKIMHYKLDTKTGKISQQNPAFTKVSEGSGPRHFTIHPNGQFVYVIQELGSTITGFNYTKGQLNEFQTISTLANDYEKKNKNFPADIHISPDGKFLYGSNRFVDAGNKNGVFAANNFTDTIVIYSIDQKTGKLTYIENEPVLGKVPRNFMITPNGRFLLVANQETDNVVIFKRNIKTGKLTHTKEQIDVPVPVCLQMTSVK